MINPPSIVIPGFLIILWNLGGVALGELVLHFEVVESQGPEESEAERGFGYNR